MKMAMHQGKGKLQFVIKIIDNAVA